MKGFYTFIKGFDSKMNRLLNKWKDSNTFIRRFKGKVYSFEGKLIDKWIVLLIKVRILRLYKAKRRIREDFEENRGLQKHIDFILKVL